MNQVKTSNAEKYEAKKKDFVNLNMNHILVEEGQEIHRPSVENLVKKFNSNKSKIVSKKMYKIEKYH